MTPTPTPCGCTYGHDDFNTPTILEWCPLHAAALEMRDMIQALLSPDVNKEMAEQRARALLVRITR